MHIGKLGPSLGSKQLYIAQQTNVLAKSHGYQSYIMRNNISHEGVFGM
jgi:hypothetical protein